MSYPDNSEGIGEGVALKHGVGLRYKLYGTRGPGRQVAQWNIVAACELPNAEVP